MHILLAASLVFIPCTWACYACGAEAKPSWSESYRVSAAAFIKFLVFRTQLGCNMGIADSLS